jgi:hypothetical protein
MDSNFKRYSQIIKKTPKEISIIAYLPVLKDVDYRRGFVKRYFIQKTNDKGSPIYEISKRDRNRFITNSLYTIVELKWRIKGPMETQYDSVGNITDKAVSESNRISIKLVSHLIPTLKLYLPNLLQFYKS